MGSDYSVSMDALGNWSQRPETSGNLRKLPETSGIVEKLPDTPDGRAPSVGAAGNSSADGARPLPAGSPAAGPRRCTEVASSGCDPLPCERGPSVPSASSLRALALASAAAAARNGTAPAAPCTRRAVAVRTRALEWAQPGVCCPTMCEVRTVDGAGAPCGTAAEDQDSPTPPHVFPGHGDDAPEPGEGAALEAAALATSEETNSFRSALDAHRPPPPPAAALRNVTSFSGLSHEILAPEDPQLAHGMRSDSSFAANATKSAATGVEMSRNHG